MALILSGHPTFEPCHSPAGSSKASTARRRSQLSEMSLQLGQVVERIDAIPLAGMNQGHEQVAHPSIQVFEKQAIATVNTIAMVTLSTTSGDISHRTELAPG